MAAGFQNEKGTKKEIIIGYILTPFVVDSMQKDEWCILEMKI